MKRLSIMFALGLLVATATSSFAQNLQIGFGYNLQASAGIALNLGGVSIPIGIGCAPGGGVSYTHEQSWQQSAQQTVIYGPGGVCGQSINTTQQSDSTSIQGPGISIRNTNSQFDQIFRSFGFSLP